LSESHSFTVSTCMGKGEAEAHRRAACLVVLLIFESDFSFFIPQFVSEFLFSFFFVLLEQS
jgi:hypothetical protein